MFWTRLASGVVLLIIAIGSMSYGGWVLAAILCGVSLVAWGGCLWRFCCGLSPWPDSGN